MYLNEACERRGCYNTIKGRCDICGEALCESHLDTIENLSVCHNCKNHDKFWDVKWKYSNAIDNVDKRYILKLREAVGIAEEMKKKTHPLHYMCYKMDRSMGKYLCGKDKVLPTYKMTYDAHKVTCKLCRDIIKRKGW